MQKSPNGKDDIKFCKYTLEVPKRATNLAVMGELGRFPLLIEVFYNMLKYWKRISNMSHSLVSEAFIESSHLYLDNKDSWYGCIQSLFKYLNIDSKYMVNLKTNFKPYVLNKLKAK